MKNTMKRIMALALILAMIIGVVPSVFAVDYVNHFTDVPTNKWYAEYVEYVNDRGWMNGIGNNLFGPDDTLERAMVATVLYRKAGSPAVTAPSTFTDVPAGKWYSNAVAWAQATGVVNGVTATEFAPSQNVLREELVTMIWRGAGEPKVAEDYLKDFPDSGSIRAYAKAAFNWAIANKIIGGANGKLLPQDNATRAEFAKIMTQFDKLENPCEAHKWDDGKVTKAATCTEAGEKTYTCTVCGKTKVVAIPALGHIDENKDNKCAGAIINIGNPENEASIKAMAEMLVEKFDKHPLRSKFPPFAGYLVVESGAFYGKGYQDVQHRVPSIKNAKRLLGWEPKIQLEESIETTLDFFLAEAIKSGEFNLD